MTAQIVIIGFLAEQVEAVVPSEGLVAEAIHDATGK